LPQELLFEPDDSRAMTDAELIVSAVPCQYTRNAWQRLREYIPSGIPVVSVTKGIENTTLLRPSEIILECIGTDHKIAALSGPTIADELARKLPASITAASMDEAFACAVQQTFTSDYFRVYTNTDLLGVELAGATKNVIAIAAGIIDGIQSGDNTKAALVCRGLAEIERLGARMGAHPHTFSGLSGLGDLITTCVSPKGRNRTFGQQIGQAD
jgi:glycerol-3-phosphate dehydrogenase (NAD(P)+)